MSIQGEKITIPSGKQIEGNYSRHAFDYVVPAGENGQGDVASIVLRSEYLALSRQGPVEAPLRNGIAARKASAERHRDPNSI